MIGRIGMSAYIIIVLFINLWHSCSAWKVDNLEKCVMISLQAAPVTPDWPLGL